jgi:hypothetical protein
VYIGAKQVDFARDRFPNKPIHRCGSRCWR